MYPISFLTQASHFIINNINWKETEICEFKNLTNKQTNKKNTGLDLYILSYLIAGQGLVPKPSDEAQTSTL